jgi:hypothetical protein
MDDVKCRCISSWTFLADLRAWTPDHLISGPLLAVVLMLYGSELDFYGNLKCTKRSQKLYTKDFEMLSSPNP